jgi:ABC-2 type transport system ATP-binding protein
MTVFLTTQYLEEADQLADRVGIISSGRIVAEGTPAALKAEVGKPRMELVLAEGGREECMAVLSRFGDPLPPRDGTLMVEVDAGSAAIAPVVRALDEAGITVESLDVVEPTLDDVFVAKTGQHLEGDESSEPTTGEAEAVPG